MVGGALSYMKVEKCPTTVGLTRLTMSSRGGRSVGVSFVSCMLMNEVVRCVRLSLATPRQAFILMSVEVPGELKSTLADLFGSTKSLPIHIPIFAYFYHMWVWLRKMYGCSVFSFCCISKFQLLNESEQDLWCTLRTRIRCTVGNMSLLTNTSKNQSEKLGLKDVIIGRFLVLSNLQTDQVKLIKFTFCGRIFDCALAPIYSFKILEHKDGYPWLKLNDSWQLLM